MRTALLLAFINALAAPVRSEDRTGSEQEVREALAHFLRAFENLDMHSFIGCFAQDATVFFPVPEPPSRFDGRDAIQRHFEQVFATIRQSSTSSTPPFHKLVPERLRVQLVGDKAAVVTFQMGDNDRIARRTLVLQKRGDAWLIVHLHASNLVLDGHSSNQSMKPTALPRNKSGVFATTPCRGLSVSR